MGAIVSCGETWKGSGSGPKSQAGRMSVSIFHARDGRRLKHPSPPFIHPTLNQPHSWNLNTLTITHPLLVLFFCPSHPLMAETPKK